MILVVCLINLLTHFVLLMCDFFEGFLILIYLIMLHTIDYYMDTLCEHCYLFMFTFPHSMFVVFSFLSVGVQMDVDHGDIHQERQ